jgi:hypothetical protein
MPRKVKQKQRQRQTQKQTVIVKLEQPKKVKRERRKRVKKVLQEGEDDFQKYNPYFRQLPPPTIIQTTLPSVQSFPQQVPVPVPVPSFNPPQQMQFINAPPRQIPFLEDIGLVGTSEILDEPTKEEQLSEMITPIPAESKKKRTKKEIGEAKQMEKEDINLGLSQFNPQFEPQTLSLMNPSISSFEPLPEPQTPKEKRVYRKKSFLPRRNSLEDLKIRYEKIQGEEPPNMKIGELKRQVKELEKKFGYTN